MSEHKIHDLERVYDSFIANIGANDDGEETAYLYRSEGKRFIGCVTYEDEQYQWQPEFPAQEYTEKFIVDLRKVIRWMHLRQAILKTPLDGRVFPRPNTKPGRCIEQNDCIPSVETLRAASRSVCEEFIELFQTSDMRPERECHELYERAKSAVPNREGGAE